MAEDNSLLLIDAFIKESGSMSIKYILIILLISLLSTGCASETNTNTNTNTNNVADIKATKTIKNNSYTHSYDNELPLQKERKLALEVLEKSDDINDTKDLYKVLVNRGDGYQLELVNNNSKFDYYYWGGIDKDRPDGYGVLIANNSDQKGAPLLAGEFIDGIPLGYIQVFKNHRVLYEGNVESFGIKFIETSDNHELRPKNLDEYFDRLYFKKIIVHEDNQYNTLFNQCIVLEDNADKTTLIKKVITATSDDL
ncbi:Uncharacterised protein [Veillonella dispar]|uniref:Uncharacterized protein n=1 Tax=Veillonella dispar TaxID=39778 RepID=A0A6N2YZD9_9FIRM